MRRWQRSTQTPRRSWTTLSQKSVPSKHTHTHFSPHAQLPLFVAIITMNSITSSPTSLRSDTTITRGACVIFAKCFVLLSCGSGVQSFGCGTKELDCFEGANLEEMGGGFVADDWPRRRCWLLRTTCTLRWWAVVVFPLLPLSTNKCLLGGQSIRTVARTNEDVEILIHFRVQESGYIDFIEAHVGTSFSRRVLTTSPSELQLVISASLDHATC